MDDETPSKNNDAKIFLIFIFILAVIIGIVWFFGWRVNQGEIIKNEEPIIIYKNVGE